jgi:hypothetical protein
VQDAVTVLAELSSARTPWLALALASPVDRGRLAGAAALAGDVTVVDITDPRAVPVTVSPFEPAPRYPVQAHADRLAGLFRTAFGLGEPVDEALRAGLRRAYADCGWDMRTGGARPGPVIPPAVPSFRQLKLATEDAALRLGYDPGMRARVRGFLEARLDPLWAGPAGLFLEGGHPARLDRLIRGNILVTGSGLADQEAASFLAGVLLLRLAEQAGSHPVVIAGPGRSPGLPLQGAAWPGRVLEDPRLAGTDMVVAAAGEGDPLAPSRCAGVPADGVSPGAVSGVPEAPETASLLAGRRSAACGERCRRRPCTGYEVHAAGLLADDPGQAWLRLWVRALVLAFLTGRPAPAVPVRLRADGHALSPRGRECLLATVLDAEVAARATALRTCYDPRCLTAVAGAVAGRMLADGDAAPGRAGAVWVIPQLRWLHEMERLSPLGRDRLRPGDIAPPLDFGLAGIPDWPGIRVTDRLAGLRGHPLAMESEHNRGVAVTALLGDGRTDLDADLAVAAMGVSPPLRLRHVARTMGAAGHGRQPGWLEVVLSWPRRLIESVPETPTG